MFKMGTMDTFLDIQSQASYAFYKFSFQNSDGTKPLSFKDLSR